MNTISSHSRKASVGREERSSTQGTNCLGAEQQKRRDVIKIAIDLHSRVLVVSRQLDNVTPQPAQKFTRGEFLNFVSKQVVLAGRVVCCYEAGCFGFVLQRQIAKLGAECLVIAPQNWDERGKNVKTDRADSRAMLQHLDRYVAGNSKALAVVRVPSEAEEARRSRVREREQFQQDRNIWANRGKSLLTEYGLAASWNWWQLGYWNETRNSVQQQLPHLADQLLRILGDYQTMALAASEKLAALTRELQKQDKDEQKNTDRKKPTDPRKQTQEPERDLFPRLRGIGELSRARIEAEIGDWNRFHNRRQVASYTGLCPGVSGTGGKFMGLSVNKCGNRRLRSVLVELAWLLPRYQPKYLPLLQWKKVLEGTNRSPKKKAIVALARRLAVDLWRIRTGRCQPEKLGLQLAS